MKQTTNLAVLLGICAAIALASGILASHSQIAPAVADFLFQDADGKNGHLYQFQNQNLILHFWASWCVPCRAELPELITKAKATPETAFLLISADQSKEDMLRFLRPYYVSGSPNIVLIHDPNMVITTGKFHIDQFPETIILNKDKILSQHFIGPIHWNEQPEHKNE